MITNVLPYSICAVLVALIVLLLVIAAALPRAATARRAVRIATWVLVPFAWLAYVGEWALWNPDPKRLSILNTKLLDDFRPGDAVSLAVNSTAFFGWGDVCGGVVRANRIDSLESNLRRRLSGPKDNMSLIWILNAKATTVELSLKSIYVLDGNIEEPGMWIGWLPDPLSSHVRNMDVIMRE